MSRVQQGNAHLDVVLASQRLPETVQPISLFELEIFFNCCCRFPGFFGEARQQVREHHFDQGAELAYALLWRSLNQVADLYGGFNHETVTGQMLVYLQQLGDMMPQDIVNSIVRQDGQGLIWSSMYSPADATTFQYGRGILQRFLHERTIVMPLRRLLNHGLNGSYAANLPDILEAVQHQQGQIASLQEVPRCLIAPDVGTPIERPSDVFKPIGIPFMDRLLGGGQRVGDINGIIGVISGGKTTTAVHMAVAGAKQCWIDACPTNTRPEFNIFFTAEESTAKVLPRVRSCAFQIPRRKLAAMTDWSQLTTQANLEPYERELVTQAAGGAEVLSETERWQINAPWLNQCLELLDVSGSEKFPHAGEGFVPELVSNIEAVIRMRQGQQVRAVYIDWVGILVARHMDVTDADEAKMRHYIAKFINMSRRQIAERFGCTVWVFHQIKGAQLNASPTKLFHHSDAAEASAFAAELTVCGCIGAPDQDTGCRRLNFSKVRYIANEEVLPVTFRIHPALSMIEDVTHRYGVDEAGRRFALVEDLARTQGAEAATPRAQAGPPGLGGQRRATAIASRAIDPNDDAINSQVDN